MFCGYGKVCSCLSLKRTDRLCNFFDCVITINVNLTVTVLIMNAHNLVNKTEYLVIGYASLNTVTCTCVCTDQSIVDVVNNVLCYVKCYMARTNPDKGDGQFFY